MPARTIRPAQYRQELPRAGRCAWQPGRLELGTAFASAGTHSTTYQTINVNTKGFEKAFGPYTIDPGTGRVIISDHPAYKFGEISEANAALIREAFPTFDIQSWTRLHTLDGKIEGPLFQLPAGEMRAAFGFNASREPSTLRATPTPPTV